MRPVLKFNIRNQNIGRVDSFLPVRNSKNYLYAEFDFKTEDWASSTKTAFFKSDQYEIPVILGDTNTCLVPWEVLTEEWFIVSVFGGDLITVDSEKIKLYESGYRSDEVKEPTPDVYTQIINLLVGKADGMTYQNSVLSLLAGENTIASVTIKAGNGDGSGTDGREIELQNNGTYIRWHYVGETTWKNLVALSEISGDNGKTAYEYAKDGGYAGTEEEFAQKLAKEIPSKTSELTNDSGFLTSHQDLSGYAKKEEIPTKASDIGAEASGTATTKVSEHNVSEESHSDIRLLISNLSNLVTSLLDSDDETLNQTSEIVTYIKSNKSLIDAITTSKVSVSDIIDNLTTSVSDKPVSAKQAVVLKGLIDTLQAELNKIVIPTALPNPHKLIFQGAVTAEYDGSGAVTVTIPTGDGGSATERIEKLSTDTEVTLEPNKLYIFPEMATLTYSLAEITDASIANEYHFVFQSGATATEVVHPESVNIGSFAVETNKIYEISIMEGLLTSQSWAVS